MTLEPGAAEALLEVLARSQEAGHLGPGDVAQQLDHALSMVRSAQEALSEPPGRIVDLGTGGGVPGLVFAMSYLSAEVTFIEVRQRRSDFLSATLRGLDLTERVIVDERRAEEVGQDPTHRHTYDLVTSRSFGPPSVVAECAAPLMKVGATLVVSDPPKDGQDRWPAAALAGLSLSDRNVTRDCYAVPEAAVQVLISTAECDRRYPRRPGVPARKPLW